MDDTDDGPSLAYDCHVKDRDQGVRIDVTLCNDDDKEVQINITPVDGHGMRCTFFLSLWAAADLGTALLQAIRPDEGYMEEVTRAALDHRGQP